MFGLYVVVMITAAAIFISHESSRKLAHEGAATMASDRVLRRRTRLRCRRGRWRDIDRIQVPIALRATTSR